MDSTDPELLQRFARDGSQTAFSELVRRHLDLVYSAARRQVRSSALAEEVSQSVFLDLSRHAARLKSDTPLVAWLHLVTRRTAIDTIRRETRRQAREKTAMEIAAMPPSPSLWTEVEPLLDEALEKLSEPDRVAILLRYFENKSLREIGAALGTSDDTAQKRVSRALDQLRATFARRGLTLTSAGLAAELSAHSIVTAPLALGGAITSSVAASSGLLVHAATETARTLAVTAVQKFAIATLAVALAGAALVQARALSLQRDEQSTLRQQSSAVVAEIARLRQDAEAVTRQLQAEAHSSAPPQPSSDPALDAEIAAWFARVGRLKELMQQRPAAAIPEIALLTDKDWFEAARDAAFDTDEHLRKSLAAVRNEAREKITDPLRRALVRYLDANEARLPSTVSQLAPYTESALSPEILARYEMLATGPLTAASFKNWLINETTPIDEEFDSRAFVSFTERGTADFLKVRPIDLQRALRAFAAAHAGNLPAGPVQLLPFFPASLSPLTRQRFLSQPPGDFAPAELKNLLEPN